MKPYKRILAAVVIILLTGCIELAFSYPAYKAGYDEWELGTDVKFEEINNKKYCVISGEFPDGIYIGQLKIRGSFPEVKRYTVSGTELNEFGKEEAYSFSDTFNVRYNEFYTNINKTVTSISVKFLQKEQSDLWSVSVTSQRGMNKYRILFFLIAFVLLYGIIFEPALRNRPEYYFLLFSLGFGFFLLCAGQPQYNAWDEEVHFADAYRLASGSSVEWNGATDALRSYGISGINTKEEYAQLRSVMNVLGDTPVSVEEQAQMGITYRFLSYLPMALFLRLGMVMKLPFSKLFVFGRLGNLLTYTLVMFLAIRLARRKKLFLLFTAMMPTPLFLASSYTYDVTIISFLVLGSVLWANEIFCPGSRLKKWPVLAVLLLFLIGGLPKFVYLPAMLLVFLMPQISGMSSRKKRILWVGVGISCVAALILLMPLVLRLLNGQYAFSDTRGGDTSLSAQFASMLGHPLASAKMFIRDILNLDNFRNSGNEEYNHFFVGNLMFLNYYLCGVMSDKWCLLLIPVQVLLLLYREKEEDGQRLLRRGQKTVIVCVLLSMVLLIWLFMYLAFTPVGDDQILGVQARYYLPLIYLAVLLVQNRKVFVRMEREGAVKLAMVSAWILETVSVYEFMLKGRLF